MAVNLFVCLTGENGRLEYSISSGDEEEVFDIGVDNGTIITRRQLDRETKSLYNLVVVATDQAKPPQQRLSSTVQVRTYCKAGQYIFARAARLLFELF